MYNRHLYVLVALLAVAAPMAPADRAVAQDADAQAERQAAVKELTRRIKQSPADAELYHQRARLHSEATRHDEAVADLDRAIELRGEDVQLVEFRGSEQLLRGKFAEAIADFDRYLAANPQQRPYHWKRGIALYYAARYDDGVKQFDLHQTVNSADVENAVWRYLCMARRDTPEQAQQDLLKIGRDPRVPMAEVYQMYGGQSTVDDVLQAASAEGLSEAEAHAAQFYAHLYIGLYLEAQGKPADALTHMKRAAGEFLVDHYMGGIAVVHVPLLEETLKKQNAKNKSS